MLCWIIGCAVLKMDDFMHINYVDFFTFVDQFNTLTTSTTIEIL